MNALRFQLVKAGIVCGTVNDDGMRMKYADHLSQAAFKTVTVNILTGAASNCTDTYDAVFRDSVKAVPVCFISAPPDIVDDRDTVPAEPVAYQPHSVCSVEFEWLGKVLICRKVGRDDPGKMTKNFQRVVGVVPDTSRSVELIIVDVEADKRVILEVPVDREILLVD